MTNPQKAMIDYLKKNRPGETVVVKSNGFDGEVVFEGTVEELEKYYQSFGGAK